MTLQKRIAAATIAFATLATCHARGLTAGEAEVQAFVSAHCIRCHGKDDAKAEVRLDGLFNANNKLATDDAEKAELLELMLEVLESGEMPPEDQPRASAQQSKEVIDWLTSEIGKAHCKPSVTRRLTNVEYENTIRDLVGFRLKLIDRLPKDPTQPYRFNNTAEFMRLGPEQIDRYLECARRVMASVIVDPQKPEVFKTRREWKPQGADKGLGLNEIGVWGNRRGYPGSGMGLKGFPKTGAYKIRVQASAILPEGYHEVPLRIVMGYGGLTENQSTHQIETVGHARLRTGPENPQVFEFEGRIENHPVRPPRPHRNKTLPESLTITPQNLFDDGTLNDSNDFNRWRNSLMPRVVIDWIEFEGPLTEVWPPEHHRRIFFESPQQESNPDGYVHQVIERFMSRAYRRPAKPSEVQRFAEIYHLVLPELKTQEAAMRETLAMVLISPQFLYHTVADDSSIENTEAAGPANAKTSAADGRWANQYPLASKLAYFLWASMPDATLLELAEQQKLDDSKVLRQQVLRMLKDRRAEDFIHNFTTQWLGLDRLKTVPINRDLFPRFLYYVPRGERSGTEEPYRPTVRDYMIDETVQFVSELVQTNASLLNIVDSDFAILNQRLAAHYGVPDVHGNHLRRVAIKPEHNLGGLLTQGSILIAGSNGSAPHPIYRAVWLREAILGDHVPEPPAEVPALADSAGDSGETSLTIKDLLAKHRQVEGCNDCHARLDPWGIPFERYNAIGKYQPLVPKEGVRVRSLNMKTYTDMAGYQDYLKSINTETVDAASRLPRGPEVNGLRDLKAFLMQHRKSEIAENVVRRLLSYSLARELTAADRFAVKELLGQAEANDYRLRDIVISIFQSETFRGRTP